MTAFLMIIKELRDHWSLVTCTFTLSLVALRVISARFYRILTSINYMDKWVTPLGRVFKIYDFFRHDFVGF